MQPTPRRYLLGLFDGPVRRVKNERDARIAWLRDVDPAFELLPESRQTAPGIRQHLGADAFNCPQLIFIHQTACPSLPDTFDEWSTEARERVCPVFFSGGGLGRAWGDGVERKAAAAGLRFGAFALIEPFPVAHAKDAVRSVVRAFVAQADAGPTDRAGLKEAIDSVNVTGYVESLELLCEEYLRAYELDPAEDEGPKRRTLTQGWWEPIRSSAGLQAMRRRFVGFGITHPTRAGELVRAVLHGEAVTQELVAAAVQDLARLRRR